MMVGLLLAVGAGVIYSITAVWTPVHTGIAVLGAAIFVAGLVAGRQALATLMRSRSGRYGANSATSVVLLLAVLGFVNYLGSTRDQRMDLTSERLNSLSDQSITVADQVVDDIHIRAFFPDGNDEPTRQLLDMYQNRNGRISYEFIDPDRQPQLAEQFDVTVYGVGSPRPGLPGRAFGTLILESGAFTERIEAQDALSEEAVTNSLMALVKGEQKTIYFVEGHGEKSISSGVQGGMDTAAAALERESYAVSTLNLVVEATVPDDAAVLVWAGPENEPFDAELDAVDDYLNAGGSVLVLVDPSPAASLSGLIERWGVSVGNDFVVDASGVGRLLGAGPEIPLVLDYGAHAITERFGGVMTFFPVARSVSTNPSPTSGLVTTNLLRTSERSWGETDMENSQASLDPQVDRPGPVTLGVVVTRDLSADLDDGAMARLVVVGDSEFAGNGYFTQQGNGNLFLNIVSWLAEDESFISIRPTEPTDRPLTMTEAQAQISRYVSMVLLPLAIIVGGVSVWTRRRRQ
jgi:ABC-type uncharacterized transport system involved in gliding motility auxiliary subunit